MEEYIKNCINDIDNILTKNKITNINEIINIHLTRINFIKHERLIHLIITLFFAILAILSIISVYTLNIYYFIISIILIIILIFYIKHYYFLENNLQYMYKQYEKLIKYKKIKE